jgi:hypothetical protein
MKTSRPSQKNKGQTCLVSTCYPEAIRTQGISDAVTSV